MLKSELPYDPEITVLSTYPKKLTPYMHKNSYMTTYSNIMLNSQKGETNVHQLIIGEVNTVYLYNGILLSVKEKSSSDTCYNATRMNLENIVTLC